jgi:hypothetical protein
MTVKELREMARKLNISPRSLKKTELIKSIQQAEGNYDCFGSAKDYCDQPDCLFRQDCVRAQ